MEYSTMFEVDGRLVNAWGQEIDGDAANEELGYSSWTAKQLMAEIEDRNEDREDDDRIVLRGKKKADAVAALEADDEAHPDEE